MVSNSLQTWTNTRVVELDEIQNAHQVVGGSGRGRRYATQQINHAYAMLLSSQFQGFCRDLHSEAVDSLVRTIATPALRSVLRTEFTLHRKLDQGNPNPGNIGADFNRLGIKFWDRIRAQSRWNIGRIDLLEDLNAWRNAISHQDFDPVRLGGTISLRLGVIQRWRTACTQLATEFDAVMHDYLWELTGIQPW